MSSQPEYILHYWPSIPGRGEYVRLAFEAAGVPYTESLDPEKLMQRVMSTDAVGYPPHFAPPILEFAGPAAPSAASAASLHSTSEEGGERAAKVRKTDAQGTAGRAFLSQTPAILALVGPRFGLVGDVEGEGAEERELRRAQVNQLVLGALDLSNEAHDSHHPIAPSLYYEDQLTEAKRRAHDFRKARVPKFFQYFDLVLSSNPAGKTYLVGGSLTTADLVLFQVVDGLHFAFPKLLESLKGADKFPALFAHHEQIKGIQRIKDYLSSKRRKEYGMGLYRRYPELDGEAE